NRRDDAEPAGRRTDGHRSHRGGDSEDPGPRRGVGQGIIPRRLVQSSRDGFIDGSVAGGIASAVRLPEGIQSERRTLYLGIFCRTLKVIDLTRLSTLLQRQ